MSTTAPCSGWDHAWYNRVVDLHAKTKVEVRNSRGDVFPAGTEVTLIEEAHADGGDGFFVEVAVSDSACSAGVRYACFVMLTDELDLA